MGTTMNTTNGDLHLAPAPGPRPVDDAWPGSIARGLFVAEVLRLRLTHIAHDQLHGDASRERLAQIGEPLLHRSDRNGEQVEALFRVDPGCIALIDTDHANLDFEVAAVSRERAEAAAGRLRELLIVERPP